MTIQYDAWHGIGVNLRLRSPEYMDVLSRAFPDRDPCDLLEQSVVLIAAQPGNPVVAVSDRFERHTGYAWGDIVGGNLAVLEGEDTDPETTAHFSRLMKSGSAGRVRIRNYRKDGTSFWYIRDLRPARDDAGQVTHFAAIQYLQDC
jgi:PAS domain S-box-containing protein